MASPAHAVRCGQTLSEQRRATNEWCLCGRCKTGTCQLDGAERQNSAPAQRGTCRARSFFDLAGAISKSGCLLCQRTGGGIDLRSEDPAALINMAERKLNLDHPSRSKEAPAAQASGDGSSDRISSFARNAKKTAGAEANQLEGEHPEAADPAERLPSNAGDLELRHEVHANCTSARAQPGSNECARPPDTGAGC